MQVHYEDEFFRISKAIESVYEQLQHDQTSESAINALREAENNLQQAIFHSLAQPTIRNSSK